MKTFKQINENVNTPQKRKKIIETQKLKKLQKICKEFRNSNITSGQVFERALNEMKNKKDVHYTLALANMLNEMEDYDLGFDDDLTLDLQNEISKELEMGIYDPEVIAKNLDTNEENIREVINDMIERGLLSSDDIPDDFYGLIMNEKSDEDLSDSCWNGYTAYGKKDKDGKKVPNCVPESNEINEHENYDDYVKDWVSKGYDITVEDLDDEGAKYFIIKNHGNIIEPKQGEYYIEGKNDEYTSFDDAMKKLTNDDNIINESSEIVKIFKRMNP